MSASTPSSRKSVLVLAQKGQKDLLKTTTSWGGFFCRRRGRGGTDLGRDGLVDGEGGGLCGEEADGLALDDRLESARGAEDPEEKASANHDHLVQFVASEPG